MVVPDFNPRTDAIDTDIGSLAETIRHRGLLQSVRVRPADEQLPDGRPVYHLVAGHRRLLAIDSLMQDGGWPADRRIPADVDLVTENVHEMRIDALVENIAREDINPVDEAMAFKALIDAGYTVDGVAQQCGVARARVTKRLELLELPAKAIDNIRTGRTPVSAVKSIKKLAAASPVLATRAVTICGGKDEWNAVMAKSPERVAVHLAKEEPRLFIQVPGDTSLAQAADRGWLSAEDVKEFRAAIGCASDVENNVIRFSLRPIEGLKYDGGFAVDERRTVYDLQADHEYLRELAQKYLIDKVQQAAAEKRAAVERKVNAKGAAGVPAAERTDAQKAEAEALRKAEQQLRKDARGRNLDLGATLKLEVAATKPEGTPLMAVLQAAIDAMPIGKLGGAWQLVDEALQKEEPVKKGSAEKKVVYPLKTQEERRQAVQAWLDGAETAEELFGRFYAVLVAATLVDERAVSESARPFSSSWVPRPVQALIPVELHPSKQAQEYLTQRAEASQS